MVGQDKRRRCAPGERGPRPNSRRAPDGDATATTEELMDPAPVTFRPNVGVDELADSRRKPRAAPVLVTTQDGVLIGLLEKPPATAADRSRGSRLRGGL